MAVSVAAVPRRRVDEGGDREVVLTRRSAELLDRWLRRKDEDDAGRW